MKDIRTEDDFHQTKKRPTVKIYRDPNTQSSIKNSKSDHLITIDDLEIAVLVPCYNEELTIGKVVADFKEHLPKARIYVYDNNSKDKTSAVAIATGVFVHREIRQGKGNVVRRMFRDIDADYYIMVDGDGTYDASCALPMIELALIGHYDLINGVRISSQKDGTYRPGHRLGNWIFTTIVKRLFKDEIHDMLSGYKVFSRRFVKSFPSLSKGFEIEAELTVHATELMMPVGHYDTPYYERPTGSSSKLNTFSDGRKILLVILNLYRVEHPLPFYGMLSLVLMFLSIGLAVPVIIDYIQTGLVLRFPTAFLSMGIMLVSILSFVCGIILDTVTRGRREAKMLNYLRYPPYEVEP